MNLLAFHIIVCALLLFSVVLLFIIAMCVLDIAPTVNNGLDHIQRSLNTLQGKFFMGHGMRKNKDEDTN